MTAVSRADSDLRTLLRLADFRRLLGVRLLSQGADGVYQVSLATYVVFSPENQTSAGAIASAMAVLLLPYSVIGPFAGVLLDRWQRRQVLLYGNLLRALLACATAALMLTSAANWLFYASALCVTAVNRFVLSGLSAALPRVVAREQLVMANSVSPTAGTLAATLGGGVAFLVRILLSDSDAVLVVIGAGLYLCAGLTSLLMGRELLGPERESGPREGAGAGLGSAFVGVARGLGEAVRHLAERPAAARVLAAMTLMRFCYGALTVMVLMLCRYGWTRSPLGLGDGDGSDRGLAMLGLAVAVSGAGFFAAAVLTPVAVRRLGAMGWIVLCSASAAVLEPALGLSFSPVPLLVAAFVLGLITQGAKIAADTVVQSLVDDAFRGRIFSVYDVLFNVAFVAAAGVAALILPADGRSVPLVVTVALLYGVIAATMARFELR